MALMRVKVCILKDVALVFDCKLAMLVESFLIVVTVVMMLRCGALD